MASVTLLRVAQWTWVRFPDSTKLLYSNHCQLNFFKISLAGWRQSSEHFGFGFSTRQSISTFRDDLDTKNHKSREVMHWIGMSP